VAEVEGGHALLSDGGHGGRLPATGGAGVVLVVGLMALVLLNA
jgi:hypothetical protein